MCVDHSSGAYYPQSAIYSMRVLCYQTWADPITRHQLMLCSESFESGPEELCVRYYIRADLLSWAFLIDPTMRHIRDLDYDA